MTSSYHIEINSATKYDAVTLILTKLCEKLDICTDAAILYTDTSILAHLFEI